MANKGISEIILFHPILWKINCLLFEVMTYYEKVSLYPALEAFSARECDQKSTLVDIFNP